MAFFPSNFLILMLGYEVGARLVVLHTRIIVWLTRMAKLETKLEVCCAVIDVQVKRGLAGSSGPNLHYFMETAEEECLLSEVEGEVVHLGLFCCQGSVSHGDIFISKMADKVLQLQILAARSSSTQLNSMMRKPNVQDIEFLRPLCQ